MLVYLRNQRALSSFQNNRFRPEYRYHNQVMLVCNLKLQTD